tara:strand:- start:8800 stop:9108 length:309 start_codon:yes stop_codon:yes gene_type:complete
LILKETMQSSLKIITVDVSSLAPPEPMTVILKQLATLTVQECLLVKHRRQPFPLYEKLQDAGFSYHCVAYAQNAIDLYIFHQSAQRLFNETIKSTNINTGGN